MPTRKLNVFMQKSLAVLALSLCSVALSAQSAAPNSAPTGSNWSRVQSLAPGTGLHLNGRPHTTCTFVSADADSITCAKADAKTVTYPRAGIKSIKANHRVRSTLVGSGIGFGFGAILGAATTKSCANDPSFCIVSKGGGAAIVGLFGALLGAPIGALTDFTAGSAIYKAP